LSSAYLPIAAVMVPERMYQAMLVESGKIGIFGHGYTYSGHPVAAAVANKTLEIYARDRIVEKVAAIVPQFQRRLKKLGEHPLIGEARGLGLVGGLEMVADKRTKKPFEPKQGVGARCVAFAEAEGLIVRALAGDTLSLCPPLIISAHEIDELFDRLTRALDRTLHWAMAQGLLGSLSTA
jgi:4-aminobutyrate---pyruvate transaminase